MIFAGRFILLPLSPFVSRVNGRSVSETENPYPLDVSKLESLKAIVIMEAYSGEDRFDVYLGTAFRYGTTDVRDLILHCDPGIEEDLVQTQADAASYSALDNPSGLNLTMRINTADIAGEGSPVAVACADAFLMMRLVNVDIILRYLGSTSSSSSQLIVELESLSALQAFSETVSIQLPAIVYDLSLNSI